jgi:antitoxin HigA-1
MANPLLKCKLLGNGPEVWLNLQRKHDLHTAERELAKEIAKIPTLSAA